MSKWQSFREWAGQPRILLLGMFYVVAIVAIFGALAQNHRELKVLDAQTQAPISENPDLNPDPSNVVPIQKEPELNPITFPQALALLRDPAPDATALSRYRLGAGVVGKRVIWEGYIHEVRPGNPELTTVFVWIKPALSSDEKAQARFLDVGQDLDFFASLKKNQWVTVSCLVMETDGNAHSYMLDCTELNLGSVEEIEDQAARLPVEEAAPVAGRSCHNGAPCQPE